MELKVFLFGGLFSLKEYVPVCVCVVSAPSRDPEIKKPTTGAMQGGV